MNSVAVNQVTWALNTLNVEKSVLFAILDNAKDVKAAANIIKAMGTVTNGTYYTDIIQALNIIVSARETVAAEGLIQHIERDVTCGDTFYGTEAYIIDVMVGTTTHINCHGKTTVSAIKPCECKAALLWFNELCGILN